MLFKRFYDDALAQASYLIGCQRTGEAVIIDPLRDPDFYMAAARAEGMKITRISETHIHADYLSGSRELARKTGAELLLSAEGGEGWQYGFAEEDGATLLHDGDSFSVGNIRLDVVHTPGHTPEHISFVVTDGANSEAPMGVLSGDFIFVGDVGRPDLLEKAAGVAGTMEAGAKQLHASITRARQLPDHLQIWPGHGAGSACGKALGAVPTSTLGYEKLVNWAFSHDAEESFVAEVLSDQPEPPRYFATMKRLNRDGPPILGAPARAQSLDASALNDALASDGVVVDLRGKDVFAEGHLPGSFSIPLNKSFTNWAGWLLPYDRSIFFVAVDQDQADRAARALSFIGLDGLVGWFGQDALDSRADTLERSESVSVEEANRMIEAGTLAVDVRARNEIVLGRPAGSRPIHLGYLQDHLDTLPTDAPILVSCLSGGRSAIAQSILQASGRNAINVTGGYNAWHRAELPEDRGAPTETAAV